MSNSIFQNPFNITKAVDFSDDEIKKYWVEISEPGEGGFMHIVKPTSPMPMLILGGKGSGKTHIMRYFSFPLQKIRNQESNLLGGIVDDKYIGIYFRCGGINSGRFNGKGYPNEAWSAVFEYYMELWFAQLLLGVFDNLLSAKIINFSTEKEICSEIKKLFDSTEDTPFDSFQSLKEYFIHLQKEVDLVVNNCAIKKNLEDITISITRGRMIFGIPKILDEKIPSLKQPLILYLIDEFENLTEQQQKYINTLIREKEPPCSFKIGARLYGIKTYDTYSGGEKNKEGSEFESLILDEVLRKDEKKYEHFAKKLIARRMSEYGFKQLSLYDEEKSINNLHKLFENIVIEDYRTSDTLVITKKYSPSEKPYFKKLKIKLEQIGVPSEGQKTIIEYLQHPDLPLIEKLNLFHLYKKWYAKQDLLISAKLIRDNCSTLLEDNIRQHEYYSAYSHFKFDLLAQLRKECEIDQSYVGLENFISMSMGLPRNLLILLKQIYGWASFNGEDVFNNPISLQSQRQGITEASEWFFKETKMIWDEGKKIQESISRLGLLFKKMRYSDKPAECSLNTFSFNQTQISEESAKIIKFAKRWSLLIEVGNQKDRNTGAIHPQIQLNRILSPRWDLPIARRGTIALQPNEVNAIFDSSCSDQFDKVLRTRVDRMNAPNFGKKAVSSKQKTIFQYPI